MSDFTTPTPHDQILSVGEFNARVRAGLEDEVRRLRAENKELQHELDRLAVVCQQMGDGLAKHRAWAKANRAAHTQAVANARVAAGDTWRAKVIPGLSEAYRAGVTAGWAESREGWNSEYQGSRGDGTEYNIEDAMARVKNPYRA